MIFMSNYKQRNFDGHLNDYSICNIPDKDYEPDSNSMHDRNRGITHFYLPQEDMPPRIISDVEIAFSVDPGVISYFSYDHRQRLANRVIASHSSNGLTDESLADVIPGNASFERSEVSRIGDDLFRSLSSVSTGDVSSAVSADPPSDASTSDSE